MLIIGIWCHYLGVEMPVMVTQCFNAEVKSPIMGTWSRYAEVITPKTDDNVIIQRYNADNDYMVS